MYRISMRTSNEAVSGKIIIILCSLAQNSLINKIVSLVLVITTIVANARN